MKRLAIVIAVMCIIAGAAMCLGGVASVGFDVQSLDSVPSTPVVYAAENLGEGQTFDDLTGVTVEAEGRVEVAVGDALKVEYSECKYFRYDISYVDGKLSVRYVTLTPLKMRVDLFGVGGKKYAVKLTVPANIDVTLVSSNAALEVKSGAYGAIDLKTSNGSVRLNDVSARSVAAKTSNGAVKFNRVEVDGEARAESSNGAIKLEDVTANKVYAKTSNATVRVTRLDAQDITLHSSNGSIKGSVAGGKENYTYTSSTSNGSNRLGNGGSGERRLNVETSNASIDIEFV